MFNKKLRKEIRELYMQLEKKRQSINELTEAKDKYYNDNVELTIKAETLNQRIDRMTKIQEDTKREIKILKAKLTKTTNKLKGYEEVTTIKQTTEGIKIKKVGRPKKEGK